MAKMSKRSRALRANHDTTRHVTLSEAAQAVKKSATAKFDETIELAFYLGVDPRHADQQVRGSVSLPHGTGKKIRVVAFCKQIEQVNAALEAGAMEAGAEDLVKKVEGGWVDFDAAVAAPDMMAQVGKLGKILGPRGLMPSPKAGTVTPNVSQAVAEILKGKIEYRVDKNANLHVPVGKASFSTEQIEENAGAVIAAVIKARPAACKGTYLKSCAMSSTMGPGYRLDPAALTTQFK
ncbi:MAG TPA: 50S ribosomal protein L1 [Candidatus Hydrogenedentes bacterium]|nr:50S ribosomal protein L1 [Candidatus Hydrogenedentota bacterium]HNT88823.1 50S ribosomal protein L1 [Candidatus Hydrogenedentota bacterium]